MDVNLAVPKEPKPLAFLPPFSALCAAVSTHAQQRGAPASIPPRGLPELLPSLDRARSS